MARRRTAVERVKSFLAKHPRISALDLGKRAGYANPENFYRVLRGDRTPAPEQRRLLAKATRYAVPVSAWSA